jgi:cytochrome c oxidase subunit 3
VLGLIFSCVQAYEYSHARVLRLRRQHLRRDLLHGDGLPRLPRLVGTIFLIGLPAAGRWPVTSRRRQHFGFEAAAWYWHFVDVVWLFLFFAIYVRGGPQGCLGASRSA